MATTNSPNKVIRECNLILEGKLTQTQDQLNRWMVVQLKKLATQSAMRHLESRQLRNKLKQVERVGE